MSADEILRRLGEARPEDPSAQACGPASVRILARLAVLEAGWRSLEVDRGQVRVGGPGRCRRPMRWIAAAALLLLALPGRTTEWTAAPDVASLGGGPRAAALPDDPWAGRVQAALDGDARERAGILRGGAAARAALLQAARTNPTRGREALELLRTAGSLRSADEAAAVAALAGRAPLRAAALALLVGDRGPHGAASLGDVLVRVPEAEAEAVAALVVLSDRGRRAAALDALLRGAAEGRRRAAVHAFAIAAADGVDRVVAALPRALQETPEVLEALRTARPTLRARLLRLAQGGHEDALALAGRARLRGVVPLLAARALAAGEGAAADAVVALSEHGGIEAWLAIARALDGAAGAPTARRCLARAPARALEALARRAACAPRDAGVAMAGLAAAGDAGVNRLADLARQVRLGPGAAVALAEANGHGADRVLAGLAARPALASAAIAALGVRLARGRSECGAILLALARSRHDRAAFRALEAAAAEGRAWLERAGTEPALARRARASLARVDAQARLSAAENATKELARSKRRPVKARGPGARSI